MCKVVLYTRIVFPSQQYSLFTGQCVEFFFILVSLSNTQEYSEDSNSEPNVDLENQYYNSKALKEDDPKAALSSFQKVHFFFFF